MTASQAVVLDVGGVLLLPDPEPIAAALDDAGIGYDRAALADAHYGGVRSLDAGTTGSPPGAADDPTSGAPGSYLDGFLASAGVASADTAAAAAALHDVFSRPAVEVWTRPTPTARDGLRLLETIGAPVAVVSNADGTVERQLQRLRLAQVGAGPGLTVAAIVDSSVIGVAKPDPAVFAPALRALALPADRCAYVGDTVCFDVVGARAAGLRPIHLDPTLTCAASDHEHAADLPSAVRVALDGAATAR